MRKRGRRGEGRGGAGGRERGARHAAAGAAESLQEPASPNLLYCFTSSSRIPGGPKPEASIVDLNKLLAQCDAWMSTGLRNPL